MLGERLPETPDVPRDWDGQVDVLVSPEAEPSQARAGTNGASGGWKVGRKLSACTGPEQTSSLLQCNDHGAGTFWAGPILGENFPSNGVQLSRDFWEFGIGGVLSKGLGLGHVTRL